MHMSKIIQLRNVPDALHRSLKARAAMAGQSLSDYLLAEIKEIVERPTLGGWPMHSPHTNAGGGLADAFAHKQTRVPRPSRVLCERAGLLADIAAADHRIHAKLLTTTRCPARLGSAQAARARTLVPILAAGL
jgi:hypothetical protein